MLLVGVLLVGGLVVATAEVVPYVRGGYDSAFWRLPLDAKLNHVAAHTGDWWLLSITQIVSLVLLTAGLAGFVSLFPDPTLATVGFGAFLVGLIAWTFGLIVQTAAVPKAATERSETGTTPAWLQPLWAAGYLAEITWIVAANLAYVVIGVALLRSGILPAWSGWASAGVALLLIIVIATTRNGFPQMALMAPFLIGVAAIIEGL